MQVIKKQLQLAAVLVAVILSISSCSTVKKLPATVAGASRARFVGTWTLTNVTYDGLIPGAVQNFLNEGAPEDLNGSIWKLTNSGNGTYTLVNGNSQAIFWSYDNSNGAVFQFKKLYPGDSARKVQEGYQLTVASIDDTRMVLKSPVSLGDKTAYVILSFNKMQQ